jgi:hypothetical protein
MKLRVGKPPQALAGMGKKEESINQAGCIIGRFKESNQMGKRFS